jgi:DNA-binding response OmpR family regulator
MAKIMLVEDDNNLREIYEARLIAEGYEIVSAKDGEEALALAVKEKPDLIISDVMMPKISGFDMLDILRTTPETKNTKIIMMTALSQAEDKSRADKLGADRYLVKSQVTLEDVAAVAREVLTGETAATVSTEVATPVTPVIAPDPSPATPTTDAPVAEEPVTVAAPVVNDEPTAQAQSTEPPEEPKEETPAPAPAPAPTTDPTVVEPAEDTEDASVVEPAVELGGNVAPELSQSSEDEGQAIDEQINQFIATAQSTEPPEEPKEETPAPAPAPDTSGSLPTNEPATESSNESSDATTQKKIIQPINDLSSPGPDLNALLEKEELKEAAATAEPVIVTSEPAAPEASTIAISPDGEIQQPNAQPAPETPTPTVAEAPAPAPTQAPVEPQPASPPAPGPNDPSNIAL